jgi:hypothetical protein
MMAKCITSNTQYAFVNGKQIHIDEFDKKTTPYCVNGHELCGAQGFLNEWYFRHISLSDVTNLMSEWHIEWQTHFSQTEIKFNKIEKQTNNRRADIVEGKYVVEIQHSPITKYEVDNRNFDYSLHDKQVLWIIDGSNMDINEDVLTIDSSWKCESFQGCEFIYINKKDKVYKINPLEIKSMTVHVISIDKHIFIESIKSQCIQHETPCQHKIYLKQQGAGNGKTWGIIQMLARKEFQHYKKFIFVTKQHSARVILKDEFQNQQHELGFTNISKIQEKNKKFIIHYINKVGNSCSIVIATIDSFMYAVGDKTVKSFDMFQGITKSIVEGHLDSDIRGTIQYAGINPKLNAETLYIIDEAQDLNVCYAKAVMEIMKKTNMDVYVVGDKLQSISNELNAFTTFKPYAICEEPKNECRRFIHPQLIDFVNYIIPFEKYDLLPITPYKICEDTEQAVFPILANVNNKFMMDIEDTVNKIIYQIEYEVNKNNYVPENFLIVLPFVSNNPLANMLDIAINEFWVKQIKNPYYKTIPYWKDHNTDEYYQYCVFHKSEEGTSINLDDSAHATRMVSIHSSKGDGRELVFVIGITECGLKKYSGITDTLRYDSLLHVAITRMKKTLYMVYLEDEIGRKIKSWLTKTGQDFEVNKINIKNIIRVKDIISLSGEEINLLLDLNFNENSSTNTQVIDMQHHNIRYGILIETIRELLEDDYSKHQIKTQKDITCKTSEQVWTNWKDYNFRLKLNKGFKDKNDDWQQEFTIPLLKINEQTYKKYLDIIILHIKQVRKNCKHKIKLCPFELITLYYMNQIIHEHYKSKITIMELYSIVDIYEKSFKHHFKGHDNCCCKKTFLDNENKNDLSDYLNSHYEQMKHINNLVQNLINMYPKTSWNAEHRIQYIDLCEESRFIIYNKCPFIGYNENNVIMCYVTPTLNKLNINEIKTKAIIDKFILQNQNKCNNDNYYKYYNKQLVVYIIATNLSEPYCMNIEVDEIQLKEIISKSMYNHYTFYNKEVYNFYKTYRKKYMDPKEFIQNFITNWDILKTLTKSVCPKYIDGFIDDLNRQLRRKDANSFIKELDENFINCLNEELSYSIREFLKL